MNNFDKQTMRQWLYEIDKVKAENKRFEELLTKSGDKRIEVLIKENRELRKDKELLLSDYKGILKDKRELEKENRLLKARNEELNENCYGLAKENKKLEEELDILYHHV